MTGIFKFKIYLPTKQRYYYFTPLTHGVFTDLAKIVANGDDSLLNKTFMDIVKNMSNRRVDPNKITKIDMFCILLNLYIVCVKSNIEFSTEGGKEGLPIKTKIDLYEILDRVTNFDFKYTRDIVVSDDVSMVIKSPTLLYVLKPEDVIADCIDSLTIYGTTHTFAGLSSDQRKNILDNIPSDIITNMVANMNEINDEYQVEVFRKPGEAGDIEDEPVNISLYNNSMFEVLKMLYRQNLETQYFYTYFISKHINIQNVDDYTPAELQTFLKLFKQEQEEQEKQRKAQEKKSKSGTHLGGEIPSGGI